MNKMFVWKPQKELILVGASLAWMWIVYYLDQNVCGSNIFFQMIISMLLTTIGLCVVLPTWWITRHNKEGLAGLGITTKNFLISLAVSIGLAVWRGFELVKYINNPALVNTFLFNMFCIWETLFIFGWMYTRFRKSFGWMAASILTSICVGIYHIGSMELQNILYLMLCIFICSIALSFTKNIFTLWPLYWAVGCTASTLRSSMEFPTEMVILAFVVLVIQIIVIAVIAKKKKGKKVQ